MPDNPPAAHHRKTSLSPMLSVRDGSKAVDFYQVAFGAQVLFRIDEGGVLAHLEIDGSEFWVADESPEHNNFSPETLGGATIRLILVVADPDALFARAVAAGATVVWPVTDQPYHWRVGRVVDPFGHHWEIGKPIE
jgi:PhnB protein